jgi:hypothetical protein
MRDFQDKSFLFSNLPEIMQIYKKIEELGYSLHSGSSFALTMRAMQYIAHSGIDEFHKGYISKTKTIVMHNFVKYQNVKEYQMYKIILLQRNSYQMVNYEFH